MLGFFFVRNSWFVRFMHFFAPLSCLGPLYFLITWVKTYSFFSVSLLLLVWVLCFLHLIFHFIKWHPHDVPGYGLNDHFSRILIPNTYCLFLSNVAFLFFAWDWIVYLCALAFQFFSHYVNFQLIHLYFLDDDKTPPSYFYLLEEGNSK